jgi:hypothetical protein
MSDVRAIADAIQTGREHRPHRPASNPGNRLQHDDLASLLLRPKGQYGNLHLLLRRRCSPFKSPEEREARYGDK